MEIVDAKWVRQIAQYVVLCECGVRFEHPSHRSRVVCPSCGQSESVQVLRMRTLVLADEAKSSER